MASLINANGVSIHAPREGCDIASAYVGRALFRFQFTHPGRGATREAIR